MHAPVSHTSLLVKAALLVAAFALGGCSGTPQQTIDTSGSSTSTTCAKATSTSALVDQPQRPRQGAKGFGLDGSATQVTFYGDLYPVLDSSAQGAAYKCTTCHANFKKPDSMNDTTTINSVISDMQTGKMPRPGDLVPADKIALFVVWQQQGFPEGTPGQAPSGYDVSNLTSTISTTPASGGGTAAPCAATSP